MFLYTLCAKKKKPCLNLRIPNVWTTDNITINPNPAIPKTDPFLKL